MFFVITASVLVVTGLVSMVRAAFHAPEGEEDPQGFRLTAPDEDVPHSVILSTSDLLFFQR